MQINKNFKLEGLIEFQPQIYRDERGEFIETWNEDVFHKLGFYQQFKQDNQSVSAKNVFRGIHLQLGHAAQGKLVRVARGSVIDYAVDLRKDSKTFGQWESLKLTSEQGNMFWVPAGFGHAFLSLEDNTIFSYKCTEVYNPKYEVCVKYSDEKIGLELPTDILVSDKDQQGISLNEFIQI